MPIERILSEDDINKVIRANSKPPFAIRNKAIVLGSTYWLLTAYELSELRLEDVMDKSGSFLSIWTLPTYVAQNGDSRELRTSKHIIKFMQNTSTGGKLTVCTSRAKSRIKAATRKRHLS